MKERESERKDKLGMKRIVNKQKTKGEKKEEERKPKEEKQR